jgi:hypothetical protein
MACHRVASVSVVVVVDTRSKRVKVIHLFALL